MYVFGYFACTYVYVGHIYLVSMGSRRRQEVRYPGVTDTCKPLFGCKESNFGPQKEQQVLLTTQKSFLFPLKHPALNFFILKWCNLYKWSVNTSSNALNYFIIRIYIFFLFEPLLWLYLKGFLLGAIWQTPIIGAYFNLEMQIIYLRNWRLIFSNAIKAEFK